ncbi:hypothetical protein LJB86_05060 [Deltaproteobacteria bacterium OttesenSCG-928-M10]|nr:hypothetical protein [Deltaproteobacteria bacterium OttesenSCG-928-M10]
MCKVKLILRWIAVFPGSILGALAVGAIIRFSEHMGLNRLGFDPNDPDPPFIVPIFLFITECIASGVTGAVYIGLGIKIAPSYKKQTAIALAIIGIAVLGASFFAGLLERNYKVIVFQICFGIGLVGMAYEAFNNHSDL